MNIQQYYRDVQSGENIDIQEVIQYIKSFSDIIVWGTSYLGKEIVNFLKEQGIDKFTWWDARAEELGQIDGISIKKPFANIDEDEKNVHW